MSTDRRKISDVLWLALQYAKQDRLSYIDAYGGHEHLKQVKAARADIRAFERLQLRLFGTTKSQLDTTMDKMISTNIIDFVKRLDELKEQGLEVLGD